jgi:hypothetical protein
LALSVHTVATVPSAPDVPPEDDNPPADAANDTATPATAVPNRSLTRTWSAEPSGELTVPVCASPETFTSAAGACVTWALIDPLAAPDVAVMVALPFAAAVSVVVAVPLAEVVEVGVVVTAEPLELQLTVTPLMAFPF